MSARDLAIGLLLGDGGGGERNTCQYIVDNSRLIQEIPIDAHYKMTLNFFVASQLPEMPWLPGIPNEITGMRLESTQSSSLPSTFSDGTARYFLRNYNGHGITFFAPLIMYENDVPFAMQCLIAMQSPEYVAFTRDDIKYYTMNYVGRSDFDTLTPEFGTLTLYNPNKQFWDGHVYNPNNYSQTTLRLRYTNYVDIYTIQTDEHGEYPAYDRTTQASTTIQIPSLISYFNIINVVPYSVLNAKRLNLIAAVNRTFYNVNNTEEIQFYAPPEPTPVS